MNGLRSYARGLALAVLLLVAGAAAETQAQDKVNLLELMVESPLGDLWLGKDDAPVTIIEYASMTCPHCAAFHNDVFDDFRRDFIDTGKVRFIIREMPLDDLAVAVFMLARCSDGAAGYFNTIDLFFARQPEWLVRDARPPVLRLAEEAGFTPTTFDACLASDPIFNGVRWSHDRGILLGVTGTPTFFINGERYSGVLSLAEIGVIVNRLLGI